MTKEENLKWLDVEIRTWESECRGKHPIKEALYAARKALKEQKKGHWIMTGDYFTGAYESIDYVKCSCCGEESLEEGNYCPNCGADMREDK